MILSILIPTTPKKTKRLNQLVAIIASQMEGLDGKMEVLIDTSSELGYGQKLNSLLNDSTGEYVWILNDSDIVSETAIKDLMSALESKPDLVSIKGGKSVVGRLEADWIMGKDCELKPTHNCPMKRSIARLVKFKRRTEKAEAVWAKEINYLSPWITEVLIEKPILHKRIELQVAG